MTGNLAVLRKTKFVKELESGDSFDEVFYLDSLVAKQTKSSSDYWLLTLRDRTGTIVGKMWQLHKDDQLPRPGGFVRVRCGVGEYRGEVDLKVSRVKSLDPAVETVAVEDFVPVGPRDRFAQIAWARRVVEDIVHPGLRALCLAVFDDARLHQDLRDAPAAQTVHHAYVGGLIDHVLSMMLVAQRLASHYDLPQVSRDLLSAACLWHDLGKTQELSWAPTLNTTTEGRLVGHVGLGLVLLDSWRVAYWTAVEAAGVGFDQAEVVWRHLQHLIASHHGQMDWGALKEPMSREAALFHLVDMIDSRMAIFARISAEESFDDDGFSGWVKHLGGSVWKP